MNDQTLDGNSNSKVNIWFWVIGVLAVLWNLAGLSAFVVDMTMSAESLEMMSETERLRYANNPMWLKIVYGVATIGGTLASIALLMKKKWAVMLFLISFVAVIIQFAFAILGSNMMEESGAAAFILPITVIVIAGLLWYYAKKCNARGWLS
jgi:hypothetical protein